MNRIPDIFIEERADEFPVVKELNPKATFASYVTFCWEKEQQEVAEATHKVKSIKEVYNVKG